MRDDLSEVIHSTVFHILLNQLQAGGFPSWGEKHFAICINAASYPRGLVGALSPFPAPVVLTQLSMDHVRSVTSAELPERLVCFVAPSAQGVLCLPSSV